MKPKVLFTAIIGLVFVGGIVGLTLLTSSGGSSVQQLVDGDLEVVIADESLEENLDQAEFMRKERDRRRKFDIKQFVIAMDIYHKNLGKYFSAAILPDIIKDDIGTPSPFLVPIDPEVHSPIGSPCASYIWFSNVSDPQSFCFYACLDDGGYFVANQHGGFEVSSFPQTLEECSTIKQ
jgi:hypothetical protein